MRNVVIVSKDLSIVDIKNIICTLLFADDQVVIIADEDDMHYMLRKLTKTYEKWGTKINFDKTKYLATGGAAKPLDISGRTV